jgi:hypothetical protein
LPQNALHPPPIRPSRVDTAPWADVEKPSTAAIEVLQPLAAVGFGLTAIGIVFQLARAGV